MILDPVTVDVLADAIADRLVAREQERSGWVTAATVAAHLSTTVGWVYENAARLGAIKLGAGSKSRLRFRLDEVDRLLTGCSASRASRSVGSPVGARNPGRLPASSMGKTARLLSYRGQEATG